MSLEARLRLAVDFANTDLDELRPGDWMNLRDDLRAFFGFGRKPGTATPYAPKDMGGIVAMARIHSGALEEPELRELQRVARETFAAVLHRGGKPSYLPYDLPGKWMLFGGTLGVRGTPVQVLESVLLFALTQSREGRQIRVCPEDGKLFFRVRRQRYCSRQCVDRANKRAQRKAVKK